MFLEAYLKYLVTVPLDDPFSLDIIDNELSVTLLSEGVPPSFVPYFAGFVPDVSILTLGVFEGDLGLCTVMAKLTSCSEIVSSD